MVDVVRRRGFEEGFGGGFGFVGLLRERGGESNGVWVEDRHCWRLEERLSWVCFEVCVGYLGEDK